MTRRVGSLSIIVGCGSTILSGLVLTDLISNENTGHGNRGNITLLCGKHFSSKTDSTYYNFKMSIHIANLTTNGHFFQNRFT